MTESTVRDVPRSAFIQYLAKHLYRNRLLECPVYSRNPANASKFANFQKWWFLEASKLIIQWYEAPAMPPVQHRKPDMTKQERDAYFKNCSIRELIKQYVELAWVIQDRTGILCVTDLGKSQLDKIAVEFKAKQDAKQNDQP